MRNGSPDFIKQNRELINISDLGQKYFFRCLAIFNGSDHYKYLSPAKNVFETYCKCFGHNFIGTNLMNITAIEDLF